MNPQPKALVLADALEELDVQFSHTGLCGDAAAELRRLHEVNQDLLKALHEALEEKQKTAVSPGKGTGFNYFRASPITVLRLPQEPVAWVSDSPTKGNGKQLHWTKSEAWRWSSNITPLYTSPPKREWVGLHGSEVPDPYKYDVMFNEGWWWAEEKLKEKNHG
jgi:hypothetical protein